MPHVLRADVIAGDQDALLTPPRVRPPICTGSCSL